MIAYHSASMRAVLPAVFMKLDFTSALGKTFLLKVLSP